MKQRESRREPDKRPTARPEHGTDEQAVFNQLQAAFPGARWVADYTPGPDTVEIDLRPLHLILKPFKLEEELATWGALDYCCPCCSERFAATCLFDAHRVAVPERPGGHRCLTEAELSRGGLTHSHRGIWGLRSTGDRQPSRRRQHPHSLEIPHQT